MKQVIFAAFAILSLCSTAFATRVKATTEFQDRNKLAVEGEAEDALGLPGCCQISNGCCLDRDSRKKNNCRSKGPLECKNALGGNGRGSVGRNGGWRAPAPFCARSANSVRKTAECIFNDGMTHGGWSGEFLYIAGRDGQLTLQEWSNRVGNTHASRVIFVAMATQEDHHADRPDAIDQQDWLSFMQSAQQAVSGQMDARSFGEYVAARVTAEMLYEVADGKNNIHSNSWSWSPRPTQLTVREWEQAFHDIKNAIRNGPQDRHVTRDDLMQAVGLSVTDDISKVFQFLESLGDGGRCGRNHDWQDSRNDKHEIGKCEWTQLPPFIESRFGRWNDFHGISAGFFSEVVARMTIESNNVDAHLRRGNRGSNRGSGHF